MVAIPQGRTARVGPYSGPGAAYPDSGASVYNVFHQSHAAMGDGRADDTNALDWWVQTALDKGGGTVEMPPGRYRLTRRIAGGDNLRILGHGAATQLILDGVPFDAFVANGATNLTFENLSFDGSLLPAQPNSDPAAQGRAVALTDCSQVTFRNISGYRMPKGVIHAFGCTDVSLLGRTLVREHNYQGDPSVNNGSHPFWFTEVDGLYVEDLRGIDCVNHFGHVLRIGNTSYGGSTARGAANVRIGSVRLTRCGGWNDRYNGGGGGVSIISTGYVAPHSTRCTIGSLIFEQCADSHLWIVCDDCDIGQVVSTDSTYGGPLELQGSRMRVGSLIATRTRGGALWYHTGALNSRDRFVDCEEFEVGSVILRDTDDSGVVLANDQYKAFSTTLTQNTSLAWPVLHVAATNTAGEAPGISVGSTVTLGGGTVEYMVKAVDETGLTITIDRTDGVPVDPGVASSAAVVRRGARLGNVAIGQITSVNSRGPALQIVNPSGRITVDSVDATNCNRAITADTHLTATPTASGTTIEVADSSGFVVHDYVFFDLVPAGSSFPLWTTALNGAITASDLAPVSAITVADGSKVRNGSVIWIGEPFAVGSTQHLVTTVVGNVVNLHADYPVVDNFADGTTVIRKQQFAIYSIPDSTHLELSWRWQRGADPVGAWPEAAGNLLRIYNPFDTGRGAVDITGDDTLNPDLIRIGSLITRDDQATPTTQRGLYADHVRGILAVQGGNIGTTAVAPIEIFNSGIPVLGPSLVQGAGARVAIASEIGSGNNAYVSLRDVNYDPSSPAVQTTLTGVWGDGLVGETLLRTVDLAGKGWASGDSVTVGGVTTTLTAAPTALGDGTYSISLAAHIQAAVPNGTTITNGTHASTATTSGVAAGAQYLTVASATGMAVRNVYWVGPAPVAAGATVANYPLLAGSETFSPQSISGLNIKAYAGLTYKHGNGEKVLSGGAPGMLRILGPNSDGHTHGSYLLAGYDVTANQFRIQATSVAGTDVDSHAQVPVDKDLALASNTRIRFLPGNLNAWQMLETGHFVPSASYTYDLGGTGNLLRGLYAGGFIRVATVGVAPYAWVGAGSANLSAFFTNATTAGSPGLGLATVPPYAMVFNGADLKFYVYDAGSSAWKASAAYA